MLQWLSQWWRFTLFAAAICAVIAVAKKFLDVWIADSISAYVALMGGSNMIFDLLNRRSWEQKLADKEQEVKDRDAVIADKEQEVKDRDAVIADRDAIIADRDQIIIGLQQELDDARRNGQG